VNALNEYATLRRVLLGRPQDIFGNEERIAAEWQELNFAAPPCLAHAVEQFAAFESRLIEAGVQVDYLEPDPALSLDAIYVRDASVVTPRGMLLCRMGKTNREHEPAVQARTFEALGLPVIGTVQPPGCLEGGDVVWFDAATGRTRRASVSCARSWVTRWTSWTSRCRIIAVRVMCFT
jgi:N-dimethylarginine dimethylaminohydrolase